MDEAPSGSDSTAVRVHCAWSLRVEFDAPPRVLDDGVGRRRAAPDEGGVGVGTWTAPDERFPRLDLARARFISSGAGSWMAAARSGVSGKRAISSPTRALDV